MRILMLTPYLPYPLFSGGQIRSYNILKELSKRHDITLYSAIRDEKEKEFFNKLSDFCTNIKTFYRGKAFSSRNILRAGFTSYPFILSVYDLPAFKKAVAEALRREKYDVIHVETFYLMHNIPETSVPIVLFEQNIEYDVYKKIANLFQPSLLRPFLLFDVNKMKKWEEYYWNKVSAVVCMSEEEKKFVGRNSFVCGNGVDAAFYKPLMRKKNFRILFLGNFKWFQNVDAARFLISEIWPRIKEKLPEAKLLIVGKHIPESLKKLQTEGIEFDENAPSDTREIYANADILLAPIRASGGTSFKVLESMATGVPVVTTPLVEKALSARDGEDLLIASENDPNSFAQKTITLLQDDDLYERIAKNARKLVEEKYDWKIIVEKLESIYASVVN